MTNPAIAAASTRAPTDSPPLAQLVAHAPGAPEPSSAARRGFAVQSIEPPTGLVVLSPPTPHSAGGRVAASVSFNMPRRGDRAAHAEAAAFSEPDCDGVRSDDEAHARSAYSLGEDDSSPSLSLSLTPLTPLTPPSPCYANTPSFITSSPRMPAQPSPRSQPKQKPLPPQPQQPQSQQAQLATIVVGSPRHHHSYSQRKHGRSSVDIKALADGAGAHSRSDPPTPVLGLDKVVRGGAEDVAKDDDAAASKARERGSRSHRSRHSRHSRHSRQSAHHRSSSERPQQDPPPVGPCVSSASLNRFQLASQAQQKQQQQGQEQEHQEEDEELGSDGADDEQARSESQSQTPSSPSTGSPVLVAVDEEHNAKAASAPLPKEGTEQQPQQPTKMRGFFDLISPLFSRVARFRKKNKSKTSSGANKQQQQQEKNTTTVAAVAPATEDEPQQQAKAMALASPPASPRSRALNTDSKQAKRSSKKSKRKRKKAASKKRQQQREEAAERKTRELVEHKKSQTDDEADERHQDEGAPIRKVASTTALPRVREKAFKDSGGLAPDSEAEGTAAAALAAEAAQEKAKEDELEKAAEAAVAAAAEASATGFTAAEEEEEDDDEEVVDNSDNDEQAGSLRARRRAAKAAAQQEGEQEGVGEALASGDEEEEEEEVVCGDEGEEEEEYYGEEAEEECDEDVVAGSDQEEGTVPYYEEMYDPFIFIRRLQQLSEGTPPELLGVIFQFPPVLPVLPPKAPDAKRVTLVLDLDETLVHCSVEPVASADLVFPVEWEGVHYMIHAYTRPGLHDFLRQAAAMFEVVLFTASQPVYAGKICDFLDPAHRLIHHRLYRQSCVYADGNYVKDLRVLGRDLATTVIIDNSPQAFAFQYDNGIPILSYFDSKSDRELPRLLPLLRRLAVADDVRPILRSYYKLWQRIECPTTPMPFAGVF